MREGPVVVGEGEVEADRVSEVAEDEDAVEEGGLEGGLEGEVEVVESTPARLTETETIPSIFTKVIHHRKIT